MLYRSFARVAETTLQLVSKRARRGVENIIQLVSEASLDLKELCWHVNGVGISKLLLEDSRDEALTVKSFAKCVMRTESSSSASGVALHKKDVLAVLWRQMKMGLS